MSEEIEQPLIAPKLIQVLNIELTPQSVLVIMPEPEHYLSQKLIEMLEIQLERIGIKCLVFQSHVHLAKIERASE